MTNAVNQVTPSEAFSNASLTDPPEMGGPNGGYLAKLLVDASAASVGLGELRPRVVNVQFISPPEFQPMDIDIGVVRRSKSSCFLSASACQGAEAKIVGQFCYGRAEGGPYHQPETMPLAPDPEACVETRLPAGMWPHFTQHCDYRIATALAAFSAAKRADMLCWIRLRDMPLDAGGLLFLDDWDPAVVDALAAERQVILFDNAGVGLSTGETPDSIKGMADRAAEFIGLLELKQVDLLGFSLGGYVAQTITLNYPDLVRRLVLAGTGPGGGEGIMLARPEVRQVSGRPVLGLEEYLYLFFSPSDASQAAGRRYWSRVNERGPEREPPVSEATIKAQVAALVAWSQGNGSAFPRLGEIKQPVLVANGSDDVMVPTINSFTMAQKIKDATLIIYPDSGHGFLFQYPGAYARHVLDFLRALNWRKPSIEASIFQTRSPS